MWSVHHLYEVIPKLYNIIIGHFPKAVQVIKKKMSRDVSKLSTGKYNVIAPLTFHV